MRILRHAYFLMALFCLLSCKKEEGAEQLPSRTVMVYMAANNNLASDAYTNLNQLEEGVAVSGEKLLVYARIFGQQPKIYEIQRDNSPEIKSKILKTYSDHDSSDPAVMKQIFADMQTLAPARSYGAILWSHATNWAPASLQLQTRSFGDDNFSRMDVQDMRKALPAGLDYLIFDACSMASVEVLYELRAVAPYILASPTEVLAVGMPYQEIAPLLFAEDVQQGLRSVAEKYVQYYQEKSGLEQSASFSLVDTRQLEPLAQACASVLARYGSLIPSIDRTALQRLDFDPASPVPAYDLLDFFEKNFPEAARKEIQQIVDKAVLYKAHTPYFLGQAIQRFSGLSTYVPGPAEAAYQAFYETLSWAKDAGYSKMFYNFRTP